MVGPRRGPIFDFNEVDAGSDFHAGGSAGSAVRVFELNDDMTGLTVRSRWTRRPGSRIWLCWDNAGKYMGARIMGHAREVTTPWEKRHHVVMNWTAHV